MALSVSLTALAGCMASSLSGWDIRQNPIRGGQWHSLSGLYTKLQSTLRALCLPCSMRQVTWRFGNQQRKSNGNLSARSSHYSSYRSQFYLARVCAHGALGMVHCTRIPSPGADHCGSDWSGYGGRFSNLSTTRRKTKRYTIQH